MKLAFSTLGCPDWTFEHTLKEAQRMGYDAIEIRGIEGQMRAEEIPFFQPGQQQDTRRAVAAHGLKMCGFGSSVSFHDVDKTEAMQDEGRKAIDVCAAMGIPLVRVFGDRIPEGRSVQEATALAAQGIRKLCAYAKGTDVHIALEVHGNFNTIEVMDSLLAQVPDENFGILWDVQHSDKVYGDNWRPFYEVIRPHIRHVHIKDHHRDNGANRLCRVGAGDVPIHDIVSTLMADGYDGYFSLEWEKKWHPELPDCETEFPAYPKFMRG